jgi:hypothetical protein
LGRQKNFGEDIILSVYGVWRLLPAHFRRKKKGGRRLKAIHRRILALYSAPTFSVNRFLRMSTGEYTALLNNPDHFVWPGNRREYPPIDF